MHYGKLNCDDHASTPTETATEIETETETECMSLTEYEHTR